MANATHPDLSLLESLPVQDQRLFLALCNATFPAEPDIGGPGVLIAFLATAYYTMLASIVVICVRSISNRICKRMSEPLMIGDDLEDRERGAESTESKGAREPSSLHTVLPTLILRMETVLESLCDVQTLTSSAIIIAGLTQVTSLYYRMLIMIYWSLAFTSFWIAGKTLNRDDNANAFTPFKPLRLRQRLRAGSIVVNIALAAAYVYQIYFGMRNAWNPYVSGSCFYASLARVPWIVRLSPIMLVLGVIAMPLTLFSFLSLMFDRTRSWTTRIERRLARGLARLTGLWAAVATDLCCSAARIVHCGVITESLLKAVSVLIKFLLLIMISIILVVYCLITLFICPLRINVVIDITAWIVFLLTTAFVTWTLLDTRYWNQAIIVGSESEWGFGQILPVLLLVTVLYGTLTAFMDLGSSSVILATARRRPDDELE